MPGTVLGTRETAANEMNKSSCPLGAYILWRKTRKGEKGCESAGMEVCYNLKQDDQT